MPRRRPANDLWRRAVLRVIYAVLAALAAVVLSACTRRLADQIQSQEEGTCVTCAICGGSLDTFALANTGQDPSGSFG